MGTVREIERTDSHCERTTSLAEATPDCSQTPGKWGEKLRFRDAKLKIGERVSGQGIQEIYRQMNRIREEACYFHFGSVGV